MSVRKKTEKTCDCKCGFSLVELLAVLVISTLLVIAAIGVYSRMERSAGELNAAVETQQLPDEILQRIAEDLDKIVAPLSGRAGDTKISIRNKLDEFYQSAQLKITRTYYDNKNQKQIFDEIIWQSNYDFDANGLILYRSHSGLNVEDKLLGGEKSKTNRELFIPIAAGLTYFKIEALAGEDFVQAWTSDSLPRAVKMGLSFASPYRDNDGKFTVLENEMITRTVALDRTRQIKFKFIPPDLNEFGIGLFDSNAGEIFDLNDYSDSTDFNDLDDFNDLNEPSLFDDV
jgi:prepilin-type N-terminal cleavage/methylation domain-containing protein